MSVQRPYVNVQWDGTDACIDFHCDCGADLHWDGYFAFYLRCTACGTTYELPQELPLRKLPPKEEPDFPVNDVVRGHKDQ